MDDLWLTALKYGETTLPESMVFRGGDPEKRVPITLLFFLIRTGERKILVDVGCDVMYGFDTPLFKKPVEILTEYGIEPREITDVVITHAHHDHIDAVRYYPNAVFYIQEAEYRAGAKYFAPGSKIQTFADEIYICGDIRAVTVGGHSPGSSVVRFGHGGKDYILVGDEAYSEECFSRRIGSGAPFDAERNLRFILDFAGDGFVRIIFHDGGILHGMLGACELI